MRVDEVPGGLRVGGGRFDGRSVVVPFGTPAYAAGIDAGDLIVAIDDQPATQTRWVGLAARAPGSTVRLTIERRDGRRETRPMTVGADPAVQIMANEDAGVPLQAAARAFRDAWLGSRQTP